MWMEGWETGNCRLRTLKPAPIAVVRCGRPNRPKAHARDEYGMYQYFAVVSEWSDFFLT